MAPWARLGLATCSAHRSSRTSYAAWGCYALIVQGGIGHMLPTALRLHPALLAAQGISPGHHMQPTHWTPCNTGSSPHTIGNAHLVPAPYATCTANPRASLDWAMLEPVHRASPAEHYMECISHGSPLGYL